MRQQNRPPSVSHDQAGRLWFEDETHFLVRKKRRVETSLCTYPDEILSEYMPLRSPRKVVAARWEGR